MRIQPTLRAAGAGEHRAALLRQAERHRRAADLPRRHLATRAVRRTGEAMA